MDGNSVASGSEIDPWDLQTGLDNMAANRTLEIGVGEYVGDYDLSVSGIPNYPIILSALPGARIKGSLTIGGNQIFAKNLDIFDTPLVRETDEPGSSPSDIDQRNGLSLFGIGITVAHSIVQDTLGNGCGWWNPSYNSILYGLWTVNNGWQGPDRGHGHGLYTQNGTSGYKIARNCLWAQGYSGGLRAYTTNQELRGITIDRCVSVNDQIHLGGHSPASDCLVTNNRVWSDNLEIGETDRGNANVDVTDNYVVSSVNGRCGVFRFWDRLTIANNTFILRQDDDTGVFIEYLKIGPTTEVINDNTYYYQARLDGQYFIIYDYAVEPPATSVLTISQWQDLGYDADSTFIEGLPTVNQVFVAHSEYDNDIAHVAIFNWQELNSVPVDFSGGNFTLTKTYRTYNAMNPSEYHEFVYDGELVSIPMTGWTRAVPAGALEPLTEDTWPTFGAFVVKGISSVA